MGLKIQRQEKIDPMDHEMTGIVLAGGKATRMGGSCDKAFLKVDGETIIDRQLKALRNIFKEIMIVTNSPDRYKDRKGVKIIPDLVREKGPLGGICSGLLASGSFYNFIVACDMPFLNEPLMRYMIGNEGSHDIVVPEIDGRFYPLFGVYSKNCIKYMEKMLKYNRLKVSNIFSEVSTRFLPHQEIKRFDRDMFSLLNINTQDELKRLNRSRRCR